MSRRMSELLGERSPRGSPPLEPRRSGSPLRQDEPRRFAGAPGEGPHSGTRTDPPWSNAGLALQLLQGSGVAMASDLATTPNSGLQAQICGDAHLCNFGVFGSPERHLFFDVNDFDETAPGPWEWDVKRLAASLEIAGRDNGFAGEAPKEHRASRRCAPIERRCASSRKCRCSRSGTRTSTWTSCCRGFTRALTARRPPQFGRRSPRPVPMTACKPSRSSPRSWRASAGSFISRR